MSFLVRTILRFNETPSHALIVCTPWTRLMIETESSSGRGHVIGEEIVLRKKMNELGIITGIEVEQLKGDVAKAQRYLDASTWWLHRTPFGVERLPVKLIAHRYERSLIGVDGWNVTALVVGYLPIESTPLDSLGPLPANLRELRLFNVQVSDLTPLRDLEILSVEWCRALRDLSGLRGCRHLRVLDVSETSVEDLSVVAGIVSLEELACRRTNVATLAPLATCHNLKKVSLEGCTRISDLSSLAGLRLLEEVDVTDTDVDTLAPLAMCRNLKKVCCAGCRSLTDLSSLAGAPALEEISAWNSGVTTMAGLGTCAKLKNVVFDKCASLRDLTPLAGAPSLEVVSARESGVTTIAGLNTCANLRRVYFHGCQYLLDLSPLAGAPTLSTLNAQGSGVTNAQGLNRCPNLVILNLSGTPHAVLNRPGPHRSSVDG